MPVSASRHMPTSICLVVTLPSEGRGLSHCNSTGNGNRHRISICPYLNRHLRDPRLDKCHLIGINGGKCGRIKATTAVPTKVTPSQRSQTVQNLRLRGSGSNIDFQLLLDHSSSSTWQSLSPRSPGRCSQRTPPSLSKPSMHSPASGSSFNDSSQPSASSNHRLRSPPAHRRHCLASPQSPSSTHSVQIRMLHNLILTIHPTIMSLSSPSSMPRGDFLVGLCGVRWLRGRTAPLLHKRKDSCPRRWAATRSSSSSIHAHTLVQQK